MLARGRQASSRSRQKKRVLKYFESPQDIDRSPSLQKRIVSTAGLCPGDVVLFDIRLCHRGMLNTVAGLQLAEKNTRSEFGKWQLKMR